MATEYPVPSDAELRSKLNASEFHILREAGTERFGAGKYNKVFPKTGYFACRACESPLYSVGSKFPDAGWVAFDKCFFTGDAAHILLRGKINHAEAACANCGSHLGHVFYGERHTATNERH